jgi:hypothetical protein
MIVVRHLHHIDAEGIVEHYFLLCKLDSCL